MPRSQGIASCGEDVQSVRLHFQRLRSLGKCSRHKNSIQHYKDCGPIPVVIPILLKGSYVKKKEKPTLTKQESKRNIS